MNASETIETSTSNKIEQTASETVDLRKTIEQNKSKKIKR